MINQSPVLYLIKVCFLSAALLSPLQSFAASEDERAAFNQSYQLYQELVSEAGDPQRLSEVAEEVYRLGEIVFGREHTNTAALSLNYARTLSGQEKLDALQESLELYKDAFGEEAPDLIDPYMELASANAAMGNSVATREYYASALPLVEDYLDAGTQLEGLIRMSIGIIDMNALVDPRERADHRAATLELLTQAQEIFEPLDDIQSRVYLAQTNLSIGNYQIQYRDFEDAIEPLLAALEIFSSFAAEDDVTVDTHKSLVSAYDQDGQRDEATKHLLTIAELRPYDEDHYEPVLSFTAYPSGPLGRSGGPLARRRTTAGGYTVVSFTVDKEGFVVDAEVVESEGSNLFPGESLRTIRSFRYAPRLVNGEAVDTANVSYRFEHVPPIAPERGRGRR